MAKHSNPSLVKIVAIEPARLKHLAIDDVISATMDNTKNLYKTNLEYPANVPFFDS